MHGLNVDLAGRPELREHIARKQHRIKVAKRSRLRQTDLQARFTHHAIIDPCAPVAFVRPVGPHCASHPDSALDSLDSRVQNLPVAQHLRQFGELGECADQVFLSMGFLIAAPQLHQFANLVNQHSPYYCRERG